MEKQTFLLLRCEKRRREDARRVVCRRRWIEVFGVKGNCDKRTMYPRMLMLGMLSLLLTSVPKQGLAVASNMATRGAVYQQFVQGRIDWTQHQWLVKGNSLPIALGFCGRNPVRQAGGALTQAQTEAQQHAAALAQQMPWGLRPDDASLQAWVSARLETLFVLDWQKKAKFEQNIATQFFADGHTSFEGSYSWDEALAELLSDIWRLRRAQTNPARVQKNSPAEPMLEQAPTGIIVNTKGLGIQPVLLPELQDVQGNVLYGIEQVDEDALVAHGLVRYMYSIDLALRDRALGPRPHVVRAMAPVANNPTSVVIQPSDLATLMAASEALRRAQIIWIIDALPSDAPSLGGR